MTVIDGEIVATHTLDPVDAEWAASVSVQALQCRELRHSWPRALPRNTKSLPSSPSITWTVTATYADGRPAEAQREMICNGGCRTRRVEVFRFLPGGAMTREGSARYRYDDTYRRPKSDDGSRLAPLPADTVRGFLVRRLYPQLKW